MQNLTLKCRFGLDGRFAVQVGDAAPVFSSESEMGKMVATVPEPNMRAAMQALVDNARARPNEWVFLATGAEPGAK